MLLLLLLMVVVIVVVSREVADVSRVLAWAYEEEYPGCEGDGPEDTGQGFMRCQLD